MLVQTKIMLDLTQTFSQNKKCIRYKGPHITKAPKPQHLSVQYVILANNIFIMTGRHIRQKHFDPKHKIHVFGNNVIVKTHISCFWVYG